MWDRRHELCCEMAKREESERWEKKVAFDEMSFSGERGAEVETGAAKHTTPPHIHASHVSPPCSYVILQAVMKATPI